MFWMGGDPIQSARKLTGAIHHMHGKDLRIEEGPAALNTILETKEIYDTKIGLGTMLLLVMAMICNSGSHFSQLLGCVVMTTSSP